MNPATLEVKLIEILVSVILLLALGTWTGYHFTAEHYKLLHAKEDVASKQTLADARQKIIDVTKERDALKEQEATDHAARVKADADLRASIDDRMRGLTAAIRSGALSGAVANSSGRPGTGAGAGGSGGVQSSGDELGQLLETFNAATDRLIDACQHDAREVTGILQVAPKPTPAK